MHMSLLRCADGKRNSYESVTEQQATQVGCGERTNDSANKYNTIFPVAMRLWVTPVPIPNTTVKT